MNSYERIAYRLMGTRAGAKRDKYADLRSSLVTARMKIPFEVYLSTAYISSAIVAIIGAILLGFFTYIFNKQKKTM